MYGKLFAQMYDGTLVADWRALVTFQQMIVLCNKDGVIDVTPAALSSRTGIPLDVIKLGIKFLEAPDKGSRTPGAEGRRIERLDEHRDWGWQIVNYKMYRQMVTAEEKRAADRERLAGKRALARMSQVVANDRKVSHDVADVAQAEVEVEVNKKEKERDARATRFPAQSTLLKVWETYCRERRPDLDPQATFERFRNYWVSKPGKGGAKLDWWLTWQNWVMGEHPGRGPQKIDYDQLTIDCERREIENERIRNACK